MISVAVMMKKYSKKKKKSFEILKVVSLIDSINEQYIYIYIYLILPNECMIIIKINMVEENMSQELRLRNMDVKKNISLKKQIKIKRCAGSTKR